VRRYTIHRCLYVPIYDVYVHVHVANASALSGITKVCDKPTDKMDIFHPLKIIYFMCRTRINYSSRNGFVSARESIVRRDVGDEYNASH